MLTAFKTVLVPADFTENTEVAISRAIRLAEPGDAVIHLLHVVRRHSFFSHPADPEENKRNLQRWKTAVEQECKGMTVNCLVKYASGVQNAIRQAADELRPDVIVIGQSSTHAGFFSFRHIAPMKLARITGIPVLTVKPGSIEHKAKTIVVPVSDTFPESKMQTLAILCRQAKLNIHLITFIGNQDSPSDFSASQLLQVYRWLKNGLRCTVDYAVVHGTNKAKAILRYAEKNSADILLLQPEKETRIGWDGRHISDVLPRGSRMQVLAVGTAQDFH